MVRNTFALIPKPRSTEEKALGPGTFQDSAYVIASAKIENMMVVKVEQG